MIIYPAIDIKDGKCVRLLQGDFDKVTVFNNAPEEVAMQWASEGASFIHVVDLDGARYGSSYSNEIIKKIVDCINIPIQVGGGIRSIKDIDEKINLGVARVILGTVAIKDPNLVREAAKLFGDKIAVGIDTVNGNVAVEGWNEISRVTANSLCKEMKSMGVKTIIYTDISKDGMMSGPNISATKEIIDLTGVNIIASGGISSMDDLENVKQINAHGAIIGKALYQGAIKLKQAIDLFERS